MDRFSIMREKSTETMKAFTRILLIESALGARCVFTEARLSALKPWVKMRQHVLLASGRVALLCRWMSEGFHCSAAVLIAYIDR